MKKLFVLFLVVAMSIAFFSCEDGSGNTPAPTDFTAINDGTVSQELYDLASVFLSTQMDVTEDPYMSR